LGRNITWYDLAFFDSSLFDSLRSIVYNENDESYQSQEFFNQLEMTFAVDLPAEEVKRTIKSYNFYIIELLAIDYYLFVGTFGFRLCPVI